MLRRFPKSLMSRTKLKLFFMRKQAITLGRVGILLPIGAIIPVVGILAGLAAVILLLISHNYFAKTYESPRIFNQALTGTIIMIAGNLLGVILLVLGIGMAAFTASDGFDPSNITQVYSMVFNSGIAIFGAVIWFAAGIIGYWFIFQAMKELSLRSGVSYFRTAGLLYFIGAIATIVLIGGIVIFIAWIIHIVAYFSILPKNQKFSEAGM